MTNTFGNGNFVDYFVHLDLQDTQCRHIFIYYFLISPSLSYFPVAPSSHNFLRRVNKSRRSRLEHVDNVSILSVLFFDG
jgi:hypothetical protein